MNVVQKYLSAPNWSKIIDNGTSIINAGVNAYSAFNSSNNAGNNASSSQAGTTIVNQRQLTPEEIKILQEQHEENLKQMSFNRAMQMQDAADKRKIIEKSLEKPKNDDTLLYILGGLFFFGMFFTAMKKNK